MPKYTVASPLLFDGKRHEIGKPVDMDEKQAEILLQQGVLIPVPEDNPTEKMTVAQLTEKLTELKVQIPDGSKKADLVKLFQEATASKE